MVLISPAAWRLIEEHALAAHPEECCGILLGVRRPPAHTHVLEALPARNVDPGDRRVRYTIDPESLIAANYRARAAAVEIVGYFHSHPDRAAYFSITDRELATLGATYLVVGTQHGRVEDWRAFRARATR